MTNEHNLTNDELPEGLQLDATPAIDYKAVVEGLLEEAEALDAEFAYGYKHRASDIENFIERCTTKQVVAEPNYRAVVEGLRRAIVEYGTDGQFWAALDALDREVERHTPKKEQEQPQ